MDAITLLKDDHHTVEALFKRFEKAGDRAYILKRSIVDKVVAELSAHAAIEEELFYPATRATVPDVDDMVLESIEEHHIVKWVLSEVEHMDPRAEAFDAKVTVLIENVRHHVEEEEGDYFPKVRQALGRKALSELGDAMEVAKSTAPTRPHPRAPSTPPGNTVANNASGVVDRIEDTVSGVAAEGAEALRGVLDLLRGQGLKKQTQPRRGAGARTGRTRAASSSKKPVKKVARAASGGGKVAGKRGARQAGSAPKSRA
jgi:hemerythrin superfamily protein